MQTLPKRLRPGVQRLPAPVTLKGRAAEQAVVDRTVRGLPVGRSAALVVRGEPGIGKADDAVVSVVQC